MKKWLVGWMGVGLGLSAALNAGGGLFVSQYYEGASNNKWIEIFNPGPETVDLAAGGYRLSLWQNANREMWKTGGVTPPIVALTGTLAPGATYLLKHGAAVLPLYAVADLTNSTVIYFNGDDSVVLFTNEPYAFANVVDVFGMTGNNGVDKSFVRKNTVTTGTNTDFNAADWTEFSNTAVDEAGSGLNERLGYHQVGEPPVVTNVKFSASAAIVDESAGSYVVTILKNRPEGDVAGSVEVSPFSTATAGADYALDATNFTLNGATTSATVTVTLVDDADTEGAESATLTFFSLVGATTTTPDAFTLTINPSDRPKHAIAVAPTTNGTVATVPADQAEEGETVTIQATPDAGYVVDAIAVVAADSSPVAVAGGGFAMPAQAVTVTVTFKAFTGGPLFISEVADPDDEANARFVELYNAGSTPMDLAAGTWYLGCQANGATWTDVALTGTVGAAKTYVVARQASTYAASYPAAPAPNQVSGSVNGNGNDGYFLFRGGNHASGVLEDAYGVVNQDATNPIVQAWFYLDRRAVRQAAVTAANPSWTASQWIIPATAATADMTPGVHPDSAAVFGVAFNRADGFAVEQGATGTVTATAAHGTAPIGYAWSSSLDATNYAAEAAVFTVLATAPTGTYWAQVVATDSSVPAQNATNAINFSVVPPPPKFAITIAPTTNGTVITAPATEAAAGTPVSVYATPDPGYRVADIAVADAASNAVLVTGITFAMPAAAATVTVVFEPYVAPDMLIDFETATGFGSYAAGTSTVSGVVLVHSGALRGTTTNDHFNGTAAARVRYQSASPGFFATANAFAQPIAKIVFRHADFGADNTATFKVQVGADGVAWTDVGLFDPASTNLVEATAAAIPPNMTYFRFIATGGEDDRVNVDDVGIYFGAPTFAVDFDRPSGFVVPEGASATVTAAAAYGTAPYGYAWSSTLAGDHYAANGAAFGILATAPTGSYSATVVATDSAEPPQTATNTVYFNVAGAFPIAIAAPTNGTVATDPAAAAAAGATVTILATPAAGYVVDAIAVVDAALEPVPVVGNAFAMPASAVTVTVTFKKAETVGALIISQYYEGSGQNKWIELYNPGAAAIDLAAEGYRLGQFSNTNREGWKIGVAPGLAVVLSNSIAAGGTYLLANSSVSNPVYAVANQVHGSLNFNGDDSIVLFKGATYAFTNVVDAFGACVAFSNAADRSYVRTNTLIEGVNTDFNPAEWIEYTLAAVETAAADVNERLGYHRVGGGAEHPPIPPIVFESGVGMNFAVPDGYVLNRVEGADTLVGQSWNWALLAQDVDYVVSGGQITVLSAAADKRMIRLWLDP